MASLLVIAGDVLTFKASKFGKEYRKRIAYVQRIAISDCESMVTSTTITLTITLYAKVVPPSGCSGQKCPTLDLEME